MAMEWGLCPLPTQDDCPLTAHSLLPPSPALGRLTEPPLRGAHSPSLTGLLSHSPVSGPSVRLVTLKQTQSHVTRAAFLDHTHHLLIHSQLRPERPPRAPRPMALPRALNPLWPGPSLTCPLQGHQELPLTAAGCLLCPGEASVVSGARTNRYLWGPPMLHSSQLLPPDLFTLGGPRPHCVSWFSSHPSAAHGGVTTLLCACCTESVLVHTPLPGAQGSGGQAPPRIWGSSGQVPHRAQHPGIVYRGLAAKHPSAPVGQV